MKIDPKKLKLLQGLHPCTSSVTFVPPAYEKVALEEGMEEFIPSFTCTMLTVEQVDEVKKMFLRIADARNSGEVVDKKKEIVSILEKSITGWGKMFDLSNGEAVEFSKENISKLTENVLDSIIMELSRYAGFIPR